MKSNLSTISAVVGLLVAQEVMNTILSPHETRLLDFEVSNWDYSRHRKEMIDQLKGEDIERQEAKT